MNDEIKEIKGISEALQISMTNNMPLSVNEKRQIFNYITNLQQENDKLLNENIVIKDVKYMVDETIYKSRCEKTLNILNNIFMLDNVTISNNAVEEIDKAIIILKNGGDDNV